MELVRNMAGRFAGAVALCILSVIPLVLLSGMAEYGGIGISEDMAGGIGCTIPAIIITGATARMHSTVPATTQVRKISSNSSFFLDTIPCTPY